ncbi:bacteriocin-like protein [Chryseobacterium viscerum]|uniref:bacteriocin-like protein n=1 Tax=Chryseobacterium viscerum TaxID=1037377 RepID=UPI00222238DC|nr:hypothetical protein [Chryseobacterium viscerum]MCW1963031.1 hypothetical protein [Chryseobacterium viscerum]
MKTFKKLSRENLKTISGGALGMSENLEPVGAGTYACCIGTKCSSTVVVTTTDDLTCTTPGSVLVKL